MRDRSTLSSPRVHAGIAGAVVLFVALALVTVATVPPLWPNDETSHLGYTLAVRQGDLPTIDTPIPHGQVDALDARVARDAAWGAVGRLDISAASHPPLFYWVSIVPFSIGRALGPEPAGLYGIRIANVLAGAAVVALVGLLADELWPRRPRVSVVAALLAAATPSFVYFSALAQNDVLCAAFVSAGLLVLVRMRRARPSKRALLALGTLMAAAALTRSAGVVATAVGVVAAGTLTIRATGGGTPWVHRLRRGTVDAVVAGIPALALAAWFYVRNIALYGDPTAANALMAAHDRAPRGSVVSLLTRPGYLVHLADQHWGRIASGRVFGTSHTVVGRAMTALLLIGLVTGVVAWWRRRHRDDRGAGGRRVVVAALVALPVLLLVSLTQFVSVGGSPNARYLIPAIAPLCMGAALALERIQVRRLPVGAIVAATLLAVLNVLWLWSFAVEEGDGHYSGAGASLLHAAPQLVAVLVVVVGAGAAGWGLVRLGRAVLPRPPAPG